jgi:hypothetical protein
MSDFHSEKLPHTYRAEIIIIDRSGHVAPLYHDKVAPYASLNSRLEKLGKWTLWSDKQRSAKFLHAVVIYTPSTVRAASPGYLYKKFNHVWEILQAEKVYAAKIMQLAKIRSQCDNIDALTLRLRVHGIIQLPYLTELIQSRPVLVRSFINQSRFADSWVTQYTDHQACIIIFFKKIDSG